MFVSARMVMLFGYSYNITNNLLCYLFLLRKDRGFVLFVKWDVQCNHDIRRGRF